MVGGGFLVLVGAFFGYDIFVQRRNRKVVAVASKTNEIVASLFPEAVRERLFQDAEDETKKASAVNENDNMIKKFLSGNAEMDDEVDEDDEFMYKSRPIADLYPETTIMFADIGTKNHALPPLRLVSLSLTRIDCFFPQLALRPGVPLEIQPKCSHCLKLSTRHLTTLPAEKEFVSRRKSMCRVHSRSGMTHSYLTVLVVCLLFALQSRLRRKFVF